MSNDRLRRGVRRGAAAMAVAAVASTGMLVPLTATPAWADSPICGKQAKPTSTQLNATTGVTKSSIDVGNAAIISGPVPGLFQGAAYGAEAYFAMINAKGGVNGRKITLHSYDDAFSGTANKQIVAESAAKDFAMVGNFSLFDNYGCSSFAQNPGFPDVSQTLDPVTNALPTTFSPTPVMPGGPLTAYQYFKTRYPDAIKHVAALVANSDTAIAQWKGQQAAMQHIGYKFGYYRLTSPVETNYTADVIAMKRKGIKMVLMSFGTGQSYAALEKTMAQQGFHPQVRVSNGPIYFDDFVTQAGGASIANGTWLAQGYSLYLGQDAKSVPAVKDFTTWVAKTHPTFSPDLYTLFGWTSAQLFTQALKSAGPNPTRGKLLQALSKITRFDASGLSGPSNPAKKIPSNCVMFAQVINGQFKRVNPTPTKGWSCTQPFWAPRRGNLPKVSP
jgi:ABC-type branched-subunit amino acid transport system substrate-binding protein